MSRHSVWGYSLAFSIGGSKFIGNLDYALLRNVLDAPSVGGSAVPASLVRLLAAFSFLFSHA